MTRGPTDPLRSPSPSSECIKADVFASYESHSVLSSMLIPWPWPRLPVPFSGSRPTRGPDQTLEEEISETGVRRSFISTLPMPAHALMFHFPLAQGRQPPQREHSEWTPWSSCCFRFLFNPFFPDGNKDTLCYVLSISLMGHKVNMHSFYSFQPGD